MIQQVKLHLIVLLLLTLSLASIQAYTYLPNLSCYEKKEYNAGRQNWDIDMDDNGIIYFGNSKGLLRNIYGEWVLNPTIDNEPVRSVLVDKDTIWVGGTDFGYFTKNKNSQLTYKTLGKPEGGLIWDIKKIGNTIYFRSEFAITSYKTQTQEITTKSFFEGMWASTLWNDKLWVLLRDGHLGTFENGTFTPIQDFEPAVNHEIRTLFVHDDKLMIALLDGRLFSTTGHGFAPIKLPTKLKAKDLFSAMSYDDESICIGTISNGFIKINLKKNTVERIVNQDDGLVDNTVLSMYNDNDGKMWMGLDYGIAQLDLNSAINSIFEQGATYGIMDYNNKTYLSTNKGLFESHGNKDFELSSNTTGQVWKLKHLDNKLFACHNTGLLDIRENTTKLAFENVGVMDIAHFEGSDIYLLSTYHGLLMAKYTDKIFKSVGNVDIWGNPKLFFDKSMNGIWCSNNDDKVSLITLRTSKSATVVDYPKLKRVFDTKYGLVFYDGEQLLTRVDGEFKAIKSTIFETVQGEGVTALDISPNGNRVAYIQNQEIHLTVSLPDGNTYSYDKLFSILGGNLIKNHNFIEINKNELRIATDRGVTIFDMNHKSRGNSSKEPIISSINVSEENLEAQAYYFPYHHDKIALAAGDKNLEFSFGISKSAYDVVEYRFRLWPYEDAWSEWNSAVDRKFYTKLRGGTYNFQLESRLNGRQIEETNVTLEIDKLWYQTYWLILPFFFFLIISIIVTAVLISSYHKKKLDKEQKVYKRKVTEQNLAMKNEQLLQYTEIISHKNEFLNEVKSGLQRMRNNDAQQWVAKITNEVNNEKKEFLFHKLFSEIHQDFITRITESHPSLTANDVRMLSFIRINLGTKEIANLMNISTRSMDTNRYRLRKKLDLNREIDLNQFIRDF